MLNELLSSLFATGIWLVIYVAIVLIDSREDKKQKIKNK